MARRRAMTKRRRGLFLDRLKATGSVVKASIAGEMARRTWYDLRDRDPEFGELWDDANDAFLDQCESESIRRAVVGIEEEKPYIHHHKDGDTETLFHTVTVKSDRLLELTLKSRHPLYKPAKAIELSSPDGSMTPGADEPDYGNLTDPELETLVLLQRKLHGSDGS
ncbi:MAG: hypothetical protein KAI80_13685 [Hyphomicrobiaceae bacterium]|nr:hypothetical protein [Hyphomicrobiaceae bacterium]